jgi:hypothetical protein
MTTEEFQTFFNRFLRECPVEDFDPSRATVILSDLHMGNGGSRDDLARNRDIVQGILSRWYDARGYALILNGDVEDLNKFPLSSVRAAWPELYRIFLRFQGRGALRKIVGNHDYALIGERGYPFPILPGLVMRRGEDRIFFFHGHQSSDRYVKYERLFSLMVRFLAKPLHIRNASVSKDSRRRFATERRVYRAVRNASIMAITAHTHRPMFESLSKFDNIRFRVEALLVEYNGADEPERRSIERKVEMLRSEMALLSSSGPDSRKTQSLYDDGAFLVPCLFNSGSATGKHGITALEIMDGKISLVYWTDGTNERPYISGEALSVDSLDGTWFRYTLHSETLDAIFNRIRLLGGDVPR